MFVWILVVIVYGSFGEINRFQLAAYKQEVSCDIELEKEKKIDIEMKIPPSNSYYCVKAELHP